jgi:50S ribosomal protein L16 3-hydroxylase
MAESTLFPDGLDPQQFLEQHWQKQPLLVRRIAANSLPRITLDQLTTLAGNASVPSRLICLPDPSRDASLRGGPFPPEQFDSLPAAGWTLLVQEIDRHVPAFAAFLERFRFIPNWRIDDAMVSYAVDGGGVGPHIDRYDVFLVQLEGQRRWRIDSTPITEERFVPGVELPMLADFKHDREWVLDPGDMLYLPPRIAHEGVAIGECITCSIGFRVPDPRELCAGFLRQLGPQVFDAIRYTDPDLELPRHLGEISASARQALRESAQRLFEDDDAFDRWVGCLATKPLRGSPQVGPTPIRSAGELSELLKSGQTLVRSAPSHFAWYRELGGAVQLFVGGEIYSLGSDSEAEAELLCGKQALDDTALRPWLAVERLTGILIDLILRGFLVPASAS